MSCECPYYKGRENVKVPDHDHAPDQRATVTVYCHVTKDDRLVCAPCAAAVRSVI